ncbi:MAG TPA: TIM barrel protein [Anaerolineae bacterium]|nr:TIM barrel protein [Anaerolineae bacterium]
MTTTNGIRFGTVGSPLSTPPRPGGSPGGIRRTAELGLSALELAWVQSVRITDASCETIKRAAEESGVALSVHAPYYINLNAQDKDMLKAGLARLLAAARAGYKAGATDIIFHPGSYMKQDPDKVYPIARKRLAEVVDQLRAEKVLVTLRPETMGKGAMIGTLEETVQLARDIDGVLPCIDFAHLHARPGDGSFNSYTEFANALKVVATGLGRRGLQSLHIHLSGIDYGPGGEKKHLALKEADLKYRDLFKALVDIGASGRVLCESPVMEQDALLMQKTYRRLATKSKTKDE